MYRILYLSPGPAPPIKEPLKNQFYHLSRYLSGDILSPLWGKKDHSSRKAIEEINAACGRFQFHPTYSFNFPDMIKVIWDLCFYVFKGLLLHYSKGPYDVIIAYGPFKTGLAGVFLKLLTGTRLIVEIPGNPKKSFQFDSDSTSIGAKIKGLLGYGLTPFIVDKADHVKLLYPGQLDGFATLDERKRTVLFDFVAISCLMPSSSSEKYILFLGYPWFLKGVDVLIKAFHLILEEFPEYQLKIVGYCPDRTYFEKLANGNERIELCKPVFYREAMDLMSRCALFVLPSRTEAMGRVLLEAMACKKPIIASRVDGIPHYVKHGFNGLLFKSENVEDLATNIRTILNDPEYAAKLGENGQRHVREYLSEDRYIELYKQMIDKLESNEK
jgi:glycosyltransferase involved in cell wall biosynthesis